MCYFLRYKTLTIFYERIDQMIINKILLLLRHCMYSSDVSLGVWLGRTGHILPSLDLLLFLL
jgi:hypothetical protein